MRLDDFDPNSINVEDQRGTGGGFRMGQVIGSTTSKGERPKDRPMTPNDLWATMFTHLGIDYRHTNFLDHTGRPMPILPYGEPISELG